MNDPRVQARFKHSRHSIISNFIISQDYYELPKRTNRAIGSICHIFEPNNYRDVRNLYTHKATMDMTNIGYELLTSTCQNEKHQALTIHMTEDKNTGRYRVRIKSNTVPDSSF